MRINNKYTHFPKNDLIYTFLFGIGLLFLTAPIIGCYKYVPSAILLLVAFFYLVFLCAIGYTLYEVIKFIGNKNTLVDSIVLNFDNIIVNLKNENIYFDLMQIKLIDITIKTVKFTTTYNKGCMMPKNLNRMVEEIIITITTTENSYTVTHDFNFFGYEWISFFSYLRMRLCGYNKTKYKVQYIDTKGNKVEDMGLIG